MAETYQEFKNEVESLKASLEEYMNGKAFPLAINTQRNALIKKMNKAIAAMDRAMGPEDNLDYFDAADNLFHYDNNFIYVEAAVIAFIRGDSIEGLISIGREDLGLERAVDYMVPTAFGHNHNLFTAAYNYLYPSSSTGVTL